MNTDIQDNYPERHNRTLKEALPEEYYINIDPDGADKHLAKLLNIKVVYHYDSRDYRWPGSHKNVLTWMALENGYAVGWNENPAIGWSFPSLKLTEKNLKKIGRHLPHLG